jgi:4-amino-4-deoxy-L-arabinose transferase-like glycosyltransferase
MMTRRKTELLPFLALVIVFVSLFARLGELPFRDPDEGRNAEVAREMHQTGAWLVPTYDGLAYLDKPAFFFKAVALSYSLFGEHEWSARLPSALFATALLVMLFAFCRREYPEKLTATLAVLIVATCPLFIAMARHVIFDMTLAFFVSASILCAYLAESPAGQDHRRWYVLGAAAAGFATLVKGPVGFVIPLLVITVFNLTERRAGWAKRGFAPLNILVFFAVVLPWFIGLSVARPDFPYYGLVEETFHRFTTTTFQRTGPFYYYGLVLLGGLFAWSLLLPEAVARTWANRSRLSRADRLFLIWAIVVVLFFSISKSKLPAYILTVCGALGVLLARLFIAALNHPSGLAARMIFRGLLFLAAFSAGVAAFLLLETLSPGIYTRLGFHGSEFQRLSRLFTPTAEVLLVIALAATVAFWRRKLGMAFATFLLLPLFLLTVEFNGLIDYSQASSSRGVAAAIPLLPPDAKVVCFRCFPPGLLFYLQRNVTVITVDGSEIPSNYVTFTLKKTDPWPAQVVPLQNWRPWVAQQDQPLYLLTDKGSRDQLDALAQARHAEVAEIAPGWWGALIMPEGAN